MSADELRQASATLRERAKASAPGPWAAGRHGRVFTDQPGQIGILVAECYPEGGSLAQTRQTAYIATMHPGVGLALAGWLDEEAARIVMAIEDGSDARAYDPAMRIADFINGGAS